MDVDLVSNSFTANLAGATQTRPASIDQGFAATMATKLDDGVTIVEDAEQLVGTRIRAPEGGCGCDAFVDTVVSAPAETSGPPIGAAPRSVPTREAAVPGEIISFNDPSDLGDHVHRAILRNATEMISAHRNGVVEVLSIPWEQAQKR